MTLSRRLVGATFATPSCSAVRHPRLGWRKVRARGPARHGRPSLANEAHGFSGPPRAQFSPTSSGLSYADGSSTARESIGTTTLFDSIPLSARRYEPTSTHRVVNVHSS